MPIKKSCMICCNMSALVNRLSILIILVLWLLNVVAHKQRIYKINTLWYQAWPLYFNRPKKACEIFELHSELCMSVVELQAAWENGCHKFALAGMLTAPSSPFIHHGWKSPTNLQVTAWCMADVSFRSCLLHLACVTGCYFYLHIICPLMRDLQSPATAWTLPLALKRHSFQSAPLQDTVAADQGKRYIPKNNNQQHSITCTTDPTKAMANLFFWLLQTDIIIGSQHWVNKTSKA